MLFLCCYDEIKGYMVSSPHPFLHHPIHEERKGGKRVEQVLGENTALFFFIILDSRGDNSFSVEIENE